MTKNCVFFEKKSCKIAAASGAKAHRPQRPLIFNVGDLKLGNLTKL